MESWGLYANTKHVFSTAGLPFLWMLLSFVTLVILGRLTFHFLFLQGENHDFADADLIIYVTVNDVTPNPLSPPLSSTSCSHLDGLGQQSSVHHGQANDGAVQSLGAQQPSHMQEGQVTEIEYLRRLLKGFAKEHGIPEGSLPLRQQLRVAGRSDILRAIQQMGGFQRAAERLGMRYARRKRGYWDDIDNVRRQVWNTAASVPLLQEETIQGKD